MSGSVTKLTPSDLAALMCGRICHDLINPVGAISTALEVLDDPNNADMHDEAMNLVRDFTNQASGKLQFLRLAFGAGGSAPGIVPVSLLKTLVEGQYGHGKVEMVWEAGSIEGLEKTSARLLLNMIMLACNCVPRGGVMKIEISETADAVLADISATGMRARIDEMVKQTLSGKAPEAGFDGRSIQPFYTGMLIRQLKGRIDTALDGETARLTAFIPKSETLKAA